MQTGRRGPSNSAASNVHRASARSFNRQAKTKGEQGKEGGAIKTQPVSFAKCSRLPLICVSWHLQALTAEEQRHKDFEKGLKWF